MINRYYNYSIGRECRLGFIAFRYHRRIKWFRTERSPFNGVFLLTLLWSHRFPNDSPFNSIWNCNIMSSFIIRISITYFNHISKISMTYCDLYFVRFVQTFQIFDFLISKWIRISFCTFSYLFSYYLWSIQSVKDLF